MSLSDGDERCALNLHKEYESESQPNLTNKDKIFAILHHSERLVRLFYRFYG
ncbi:hypothetical protein AO366_0516 [Moraxella catarrhalis]|nr:hypothetical protein AO381_1314 [Moraxella catarrhalis]OAV03408.1 hypothetical protein AO380_1746 [Moraxella catarrhalis]OAV06853.1 hypothetical protein AO379_0562 [Moraxella catarrhalis]OAV10754.1 hypothetical protein AO377_0552 [Moraxella catarrhalis]OAV11873.1 hypothetical protein AO378_0195 [Moraxella catarrhalis]